MTTDEWFASIEERFRRARRTPFFRLGPTDWKLIERWRLSGIPLELIRRGIDRTFAAWRNKPRYAQIERPNSLAYCARAVEQEARALGTRV